MNLSLGTVVTCMACIVTKYESGEDSIARPPRSDEDAKNELQTKV